ncbi:isochorismate synthase [Bacteroidales bacterium KHT7]|nr:isochorismate synthase [Bacteroidales bacterium KHT7]
MTEEQRNIAELFVAEESIALYRLPFSDEFTVVVQDRRKATSETDGFVMMPFAESEVHPTVVISPDRTVNCKYCIDDFSNPPDKEIKSTTLPDECYNSAFEKFSKALNDGIFEKLVLSRCEKIPFENIDAFGSFLKACAAYPRMMVYLAKTPATGIWLGCTPEILLSGEKSHYRTVALAGTMAADDNDIRNLVWSEKNKEEQAVVASYIRSRLNVLATVIEEEGPYTSKAGNLVHLKSEFHFSPKPSCSLADIIGSLHPTPAVCGLPKDEALAFILKNEGYDRSYYSGIVGMLDSSGTTNLYVNLRCANLSEGIAYAGGGLLRQSDVRSEWNETEEKLKTIKKIL